MALVIKSNFGTEVYSQVASDIYDATLRGLSFDNSNRVPMFAFAVDTPAMPFAMDSALNLTNAIVTGIRHMILNGNRDGILRIYRVGHYRVVDSRVGCDDEEHMLIASYQIARYVDWYTEDDTEVHSDDVS